VRLVKHTSSGIIRGQTRNIEGFSVSTASPVTITRRQVGANLWFERSLESRLSRLPTHELHPEVVESEEAVGRVMLEELESLARSRLGDLVIILLGGRGAQAFHRLLGEKARAGDPDGLIARLCVFTQDALAPLPMENGFSFVRDFERLLGPEFFSRVKSFTPMQTDVADLDAELIAYADKLEKLGGIDIFFLGHGPEPDDASHLAYIRSGSGATAASVAGMIPIAPHLLDHHINKFKAGGSAVNAEAEAECRRATTILTLGPAIILRAKRIVQSIVDADTAPAKRASYRRVMETRIADDSETRARQLDENPGLWIRLHPNVRSLILPNVLI
jgi:6-phosphogluconolactonase/glucosamine-6-phosphate isomerase/deaminase